MKPFPLPVEHRFQAFLWGFTTRDEFLDLKNYVEVVSRDEVLLTEVRDGLWITTEITRIEPRQFERNVRSFFDVRLVGRIVV